MSEYSNQARDSIDSFLLTFFVTKQCPFSLNTMEGTLALQSCQVRNCCENINLLCEENFEYTKFRTIYFLFLFLQTTTQCIMLPKSQTSYNGAGALLRFLPPYRPDLNPIEGGYHQPKEFIRENDIAFRCCFQPRFPFCNQVYLILFKSSFLSSEKM